MDTTTSKCVCPAGTFENKITNQCVACLPPRIWNAEINSCICPPSLPYENKVTLDCEECPVDRPMWNFRECVACPANHEFNKFCHCCCLCVEGTHYNKTIHRCELDK